MQTEPSLHLNNHFLVFLLDDVKYGVKIENVQSVVRAVEITQVPESDPIVCGIINLHGAIVPIVNVRMRFKLPAKRLRASDHIIIMKSGERLFGIVVDAVSGYFYAPEITEAEAIWPGMEYVDAVAKEAGGMILINSISRLFLDTEAAAIAAIAPRVEG